MGADYILAALKRERFGTVPELRREQYQQPLDPPTDGPRDWLRRQATLLEALEGASPEYRRGCPRGARRTADVSGAVT